MESNKELVNIYKLVPKDGSAKFVQFLVNNNWFGIAPITINHSVYIKKEDYKRIKSRIDFYFECQDANLETRTKMVAEKYMPKETYKILETYLRNKKIDKSLTYHIVDFLAYNLPGELTLCVDKEIEDIMAAAGTDLAKDCRTILCDFLQWVQSRYKTCYKVAYRPVKTFSVNTDAYDEDLWLKLLYMLFNQEYIKKNKMFEKACFYKDYIDTWLFLSLHCICALRITDLKRIPDPVLNAEPDKVIQKIKKGEFDKADSIAVLNSIMTKLNYYDFKPNKTKNRSNVPQIKLFIPSSLEEHFGKLFALAEAHKIINYSNPSCTPLITPVSTYKDIAKNMGEEIASLFINSDFSSRRANKSYLQIIEIMTDKVLGSDTFNTKGYMLASLARSHKGSYGEYAKTTSIYLKDAKMNGLTPEYVAKELFERKPLSFVVSMMLKIVTNNQYNLLPVHDQTQLISAVNLLPSEIDKVANITDSSLKSASKIVAQIYQNNIDIKELLHKIGNCEASGKTSDCLLVAANKMCPFSDRKVCIGCEYEIKTKTTLYVMVDEMKRLKNEYLQSENPYERAKIESLLLNNVLPSINEMYICLKELYGENEADAFRRLIND